MVDEPKPAIVPTISEKKPIIMKKMSTSSTFTYQSIECKLSVKLHFSKSIAVISHSWNS